MENQTGKIITIDNQTLEGKFDTDLYTNCVFYFENCKFINFEFKSDKNSIIFLEGNTFINNICLEADKVAITKSINDKKLINLFIDGDYCLIEKKLQLSALDSIIIKSDVNQLNNVELSSKNRIILQSSNGNVVYSNCFLKADKSIKVISSKDNLRINNCVMEVSENKENNKEEANGIYIYCYGRGDVLSIEDSKFKTDLLEVIHPKKFVIDSSLLYLVTTNGRFTSRNHEVNGRVFSYQYVEPRVYLEKLFKNSTIKPEEKSKMKKLIKILKK